MLALIWLWFWAGTFSILANTWSPGWSSLTEETHQNIPGLQTNITHRNYIVRQQSMNINKCFLLNWCATDSKAVHFFPIHGQLSIFRRPVVCILKGWKYAFRTIDIFDIEFVAGFPHGSVKFSIINSFFPKIQEITIFSNLPSNQYFHTVTADNAKIKIALLVTNS